MIMEEVWPEGAHIVVQVADVIEYIKYLKEVHSWNWTLQDHRRFSRSLDIKPIYPQDTEDFDYYGNAVKYLNGRKLTWDVDKQDWQV